MPGKNCLIIHGAFGSPQGNWFPWLKRELEKDGWKVKVPTFPTPEGQSLSAWQKIAESELVGVDAQNTVLVGHSIGAALALRLAEITKLPYKALFLVSPFLKKINLPDLDAINATFYEHQYDWAKIISNAGRIHSFAGDNDPYVPLGHSEEVALNAKSDLVVIKEGGHLNAEFGYDKFPLLLDAIMALKD